MWHQHTVLITTNSKNNSNDSKKKGILVRRVKTVMIHSVVVVGQLEAWTGSVSAFVVPAQDIC